LFGQCGCTYEKDIEEDLAEPSRPTPVEQARVIADLFPVLKKSPDSDRIEVF
jgi:hypothetical protein